MRIAMLEGLREQVSIRTCWCVPRHFKLSEGLAGGVADGTAHIA
jgi:hypothetical protein